MTSRENIAEFHNACYHYFMMFRMNNFELTI